MIPSTGIVYGMKQQMRKEPSDKKYTTLERILWSITNWSFSRDLRICSRKESGKFSKELRRNTHCEQYGQEKRVLVKQFSALCGFKCFQGWELIKPNFSSLCIFIFSNVSIQRAICPRKESGGQASVNRVWLFSTVLFQGSVNRVCHLSNEKRVFPALAFLNKFHKCAKEAVIWILFKESMIGNLNLGTTLFSTVLSLNITRERVGGAL